MPAGRYAGFDDRRPFAASVLTVKLGTLAPSEYSEFRGILGPASGLQ